MRSHIELRTIASAKNWIRKTCMPGRYFCILSALWLAPGASSLEAQNTLLVYRLGTDTLAVEQYSRTGNRLTGEMVQRSGAAISRMKYDVTVGSDGRPSAATITRLQADGSPIANAPAETRFRVTADSVIRESVWPDSVQRRAFAAKGAIINFPLYLFGPTELLAAMKKSGKAVDSLPAVGIAGNLAVAGLTAVGGDTLKLRGGPYAMLLRYDGSSRLQSVDGSLTTNKAVASRGSGTVDLNALARNMKPTGTLSVRDDARASFGPGGMVLIDYGRPLVRDRTVWGGTLIPYDSVWRVGANDATHLFTTRTLVIGDLTLAPGMYTLWVQHMRDKTMLIVNSQTGQWGTQYDPSKDLGHVPLTLTAAPSHVEEFTITVRSLAGNRGAIDMAWGDKMASVPFTVTTAR